MHKLLLFLTLFATTTFVSAQVTNPATSVEIPKIYELFDTTLQQLPSYPGGEAELFGFLRHSISYPAAAREKAISGVVPVVFVVDASGNIGEVKALRDIGGGCGVEAVRVVKSMPKWNPGMIGGKAVAVRYTIPVKFSMQ
jgi:periplasmic protein TonB